VTPQEKAQAKRDRRNKRNLENKAKGGWQVLRKAK
jgi:hypothetical protein